MTDKPEVKRARRMVTGICEWCDFPFTGEDRGRGRRFCSHRCSGLARSREMFPAKPDPAAVTQVPVPGACPHHWMVEPPKKGEQRAKCKLCGAEKVFTPQFAVSWEDHALRDATRQVMERGA